MNSVDRMHETVVSAQKSLIALFTPIRQKVESSFPANTPERASAMKIIAGIKRGLEADMQDPAKIAKYAALADQVLISTCSQCITLNVKLILQ